jgi:hypothetical protein
MTDDTDESGIEERLAAVEAAVRDLEETVATASNRDIPLLKGTMRSLVGGIETIDDLPDAGRAFQQRCADREKRLRAVETRLETLGDAGAARSTKAEKYVSVLAFAANKRTGSAKVALSPAEIRGCTGVSRRYAYDLLESMAADIDGARVRDATRVDTGSGVKRKGKALLVDCAHVHVDGEGVNQFTTGGGAGGDR